MLEGISERGKKCFTIGAVDGWEFEYILWNFITLLSGLCKELLPGYIDFHM